MQTDSLQMKGCFGQQSPGNFKSKPRMNQHVAPSRALQAVALTSVVFVCGNWDLHIMGIKNSVDDLENDLEFLKKLRIIIRWTSIFTLNSEENEMSSLGAGACWNCSCLSPCGFWGLDSGCQCQKASLPAEPSCQAFFYLMWFLENSKHRTQLFWILVSVLVWFFPWKLNFLILIECLNGESLLHLKPTYKKVRFIKKNKDILVGGCNCLHWVNECLGNTWSVSALGAEQK